MNRLVDEPSPYLRQHADNPVDWYPWGEEALEAAVQADKPILLSIGYSACHWCHVMAHESFEDEETATLMNERFINIKVDREERPDIDALYMEAVVTTTGHGGWPMTVFLTPAGEPFFAGTYFPPQPRLGMPAFGEILEAASRVWAERREDTIAHAQELVGILAQNASPDSVPFVASRAVVNRAVGQLTASHDRERGGFGTAPKFPNPLALDVLFRHYSSTGDVTALSAATKTLDHMAAGGIYDHLGGGFARYSVDGNWLIPHFEKMLNDNALLVPAYLHGWQLTGHDDYAQVVVETIGYVLRDLRLPDDGLASAEDADSEGVEGLFYAWSDDELAETLNPEELEIATDWYGVRSGGNFEGRHVLHRPVTGRLARDERTETLRRRLFTQRETRVRPGLDDKVLTEWNALMAAALAEAGGALRRTDWTTAAAEIMDFLFAALTDDAGRWYRSWHRRSGKRHLAYAADYAAVVDACTRLGETTGEARWHQRAISTADAMIELFWDDVDDGLFTTGSDAEQLLVRRKELTDNPIASANANAAFVLRRIAVIHGRDDLASRSEAILALVGPHLDEQPLAFGRSLAALDLQTSASAEIVVVGHRPDLVATIQRRYLPNAVLVHGEPFPSPLWEGRDGDQAFVCRDYTCALPVGDSRALAKELDGLNRR